MNLESSQSSAPLWRPTTLSWERALREPSSPTGSVRNPSVQVVALEAGPRDKDKFIHIPARFAKLMRGDVDWDYLTEPQKELDGREIYCPRGKMLGGSSSMNAMMWVRGFAADYDEWGEHAGEQWNYANIVALLRPHRARSPCDLPSAQST